MRKRVCVWAWRNCGICQLSKCGAATYTQLPLTSRRHFWQWAELLWQIFSLSKGPGCALINLIFSLPPSPALRYICLLLTQRRRWFSVTESSGSVLYGYHASWRIFFFFWWGWWGEPNTHVTPCIWKETSGQLLHAWLSDFAPCILFYVTV